MPKTASIKASKFETSFWSGEALEKIYKRISAKPGDPMARTFCSGMNEWKLTVDTAPSVEGDLRDGLHPVDALRAAFPAGTLTGAPKVRAMELIAQLEPDRRGAYGGVVGYVGHGRTLDMAITIRTALVAGGVASVQAGAGIVAASDPAAEEAETRHKSRSVLAALELAEQVSRTLPASDIDAITMGGIA